jgi:hypothetical protein
MKDLTHDEFEKAPHTIQYLYMMALSKSPVGTAAIESAMKDYPEYFPDELEHRRKWDLIPQDVHNEYWGKFFLLHSECYKSLPRDTGILQWATGDNEGYKKWNEEYEKCRKKEKEAEPLFRKLHAEYYEKWGIPYKVSVGF